MIKRFFQKLRAKTLIFRLHKLSASAFVLNQQIQKTKLPDELKLVSNELVKTYAGFLLITNNNI